MWTQAFLFYSVGYDLLLLLFDVQIMPDLVSGCAFKAAFCVLLKRFHYSLSTSLLYGTKRCYRLIQGAPLTMNGVFIAKDWLSSQAPSVDRARNEYT